jgi:transposase
VLYEVIPHDPKSVPLVECVGALVRYVGIEDQDIAGLRYPEFCGHSRLDTMDRGGCYGENSSELYFRVSSRSRQIGAQGLSLLEASQRISVPKGTLAGWVANARGGKAVGIPGARTIADLEAENKMLRKELAQIRMEGTSKNSAGRKVYPKDSNGCSSASCKN